MNESIDSDDSDEENNITFTAAGTVSIPIIVFVLILPLFVLEKSNVKIDRSRNGKRTRLLMWAVIISNAIFALLYLMKWTMCLQCPFQFASFFGTRWIMRWLNMLFLIHRAKLAQGMDPIFSKKWFNKILPRIVTGFTFIFLLLTTVANLTKEYVCESYTDSEVFSYCFPANVDDIKTKEKRISRGVLAFILMFDLVFTVLLVILFVVPLRRVYRTDLGALNDNQLRQRMKLRTLLIWSVVMCFINQITSILHMLPVFGQSPAIWILWSIGKFDPAINVWTSWLMITRNRQFLWRWMRCGCCRAKQGERSMAHSAFTDISDVASRSGTSSISRRFARLNSQSSIPRKSLVDIALEEQPREPGNSPELHA